MAVDRQHSQASFMSDEQIQPYFQAIRQQIAVLKRVDLAVWTELDAALEDLQVIYEQMQTSLETVGVIEEELFQQKQHYHDLFLFSPIAYLLTDADGLILEANQAIANLLNVPHCDLVRKPLAAFVTPGDRQAFRTCLNRLSQSIGIQIWQSSLSPRHGESIVAELHVVSVRNSAGLIENLRIAVYNLSQSRQATTHSTQQPLQAAIPIARSPQSLDGLRVLVVDDEADTHEFITALLEAHGIGARAVASAAAALAELERFRPDVLLSDIRMPGGDGYHLIRQIRALEAQQGGHLPAAAITAYLDEDREKAIAAGFEVYLHKLAQPTTWIETVTGLAEQSSNRRRSS